MRATLGPKTSFVILEKPHALLLSVFLLFVSSAAWADTLREIALTTYLRDGPGLGYRAVDEAETGTRVSVLGCANGWCNVMYEGVSGYVAQTAVASAPPAFTSFKAQNCFVDGQASYHGNRAVQFCQSAAPAKP